MTPQIRRQAPGCWSRSTRLGSKPYLSALNCENIRSLWFLHLLATWLLGSSTPLHSFSWSRYCLDEDV